MTEEQLALTSKIAALSPPRCKKCPQPRFMIADDTKVSKKHFDDGGNLTVISFGLKVHSSNLCYYHLKKELGIFDAKYPLKYKLGGGEI